MSVSIEPSQADKNVCPTGAFSELSAQVARLQNSFPESVPEVVRRLLQAGFSVDASDVHLEPLPDRMLARFRIDGSLVDGAVLDGRARANVIARVKVLAGLMTYRTDIPQEGRIAANAAEDLRADLRVSVYPAIHGERAVIRFPARHGGAEPADGGGHALERLGFPADVLERLQRLLEMPHGLILLTGPAGSGKTTTLYASLRHLSARWEGRRHIVTIEDPVERIVPGITQTQINPGVELDYAAALRALLRQDPEILMVGEIRDAATACMAAQAALTGHLLLSTLHAGTPVEVLLRLTQLGVEPYLAGSVVTGVLAQRLVRKSSAEKCGTRRTRLRCKRATARDFPGGSWRANCWSRTTRCAWRCATGKSGRSWRNWRSRRAARDFGARGLGIGCEGIDDDAGIAARDGAGAVTTGFRVCSMFQGFKGSLENIIDPRTANVAKIIGGADIFPVLPSTLLQTGMSAPTPSH